MTRKNFYMIGVGLLLIFMLASCFSKEADKSDAPDNPGLVIEKNDKPEVEELMVGALKNVKGDVQVVDENDSHINSSDGMEIAQGWSIKTGSDSSASIEFSPDMEAFIGSNAHISIVKTTDGDDEIILAQHAGLVYHAGHHDNYLVQTESAEVSPVGTHFLMNVDPRTGDLMITVYSGIVSARSDQSSAQSDEDNESFNLYPSQSMRFYQNDDVWERYLESHLQGMEDMDRSILEAFIINTNEIATENEALLRSIRDQLNRGDSPEGLDPEMDLEELRNRLDRLIGDIVSLAIQSNIVSEEDVERIIQETNARRDENDRIDIARILPDDARREQLREVQQERDQQQREEREQRQRELREGTQDRQAQLLAEQERAERERQAQLRQRQKAAAEGVAAREALKKQLEEEKKKQEEMKKKEEQERKRLAEEERKQLADKEQKRLAEERAKQIAPAHGPLNLTFIDKSPLAGNISGDIVVGRASDESKIDGYVLYWVNSKGEKIGKIASLNKTGKDMKYKLEETDIPKHATGILALASNRYGESVPSAYMELVDLQAMSVKNHIDDFEIFWGEDKNIDVSNVFIDKDGGAIVHGSRDYTWEVTSSNEEVIPVSFDEKLYFYDVQPGNSIMTITVTDDRTKESISESFKVTVKPVTVSGTVRFNGSIDDKDLTFGIVGYHDENNSTLGLYTKQLNLKKSELNFNLELPYHANRIKYGFANSGDSASLISNIFEFGEEMEVDLAVDKDKKINLVYDVTKKTYKEDDDCPPDDCFNYPFIFGEDYEHVFESNKMCTLSYGSYQCSDGEYAIEVVETLVNSMREHSNDNNKSYIFYQSENNVINDGNIIILNYIR